MSHFLRFCERKVMQLIHLVEQILLDQMLFLEQNGKRVKFGYIVCKNKICIWNRCFCVRECKNVINSTSTQSRNTIAFHKGCFAFVNLILIKRHAILSFPLKQYVSLTHAKWTQRMWFWCSKRWFCIPQMGHIGECSRDTPFVRRVCKSLGPLEASKLKYEAVHQRHLKHANLHLKIQTSNLSFSRGDKCTQPNSLLKTVNGIFTVVAFFVIHL